jgi:hypothetical protein
VRVHGDRPVRKLHEDHFGRFCAPESVAVSP